MARKSNKTVRQSKLTRWQKKKETRTRKSNDLKNGRSFFAAVKGEQTNEKST